MLKKLLLIGFMLAPVAALAEWDNSGSKYGSKYDYKTGNSYDWSTNSTGDTNVNGRNSRTGSNWNTTIEKDGDMRGRDSQGNSWTYDKSADRYYNYGTGETRQGSYYNPGWKR